MEPWLDATNRVQFAPGAWLSAKLSDAAGPLLAKIGIKPMSKELATLMRKIKLQVQTAQETAVGVTVAMRKFSDGDRLMISEITEQEPAAGVTPPAHAIQMAATMSQAMSDQSREPVALDMLSEQAADRWDGKYLPRRQSKLGNRHETPGGNLDWTTRAGTCALLTGRPLRPGFAGRLLPSCCCPART
jgi:hypothetical protein